MLHVSRGAAAVRLASEHGHVDANPCRCWSWKQVYAGHHVSCGEDGPELAWAAPPGVDTKTVKKHLGEEFCTRFYERIRRGFCTQLHFSRDRREQWCYVSRQCEELNGGGEVGDLRWKVCKPGADRMLGEMEPQELHSIAMAEQLDPGLLFKMAYPVSQRKDLVWADVRRCFNGTSHQPRKCKAMRELMARGSKVIVDSKDHHPPFGFVDGETLVESHFTEFFWEMVKKGRDIWKYENPGRMNAYTCVAGCDDGDDD